MSLEKIHGESKTVCISVHVIFTFYKHIQYFGLPLFCSMNKAIFLHLVSYFCRIRLFIILAYVNLPFSGDNERLHNLLYKNCLISACMSDTICTIAAVNTLLGFSDYESCPALKLQKKDQIIKITDII